MEIKVILVQGWVGDLVEQTPHVPAAGSKAEHG